MATPPHGLDPLFGRDADLVRIREALALGRLLTLTGPGGSGKTRLARAVVDATGEGSWFVDASGLTDAGLLPSTLLATLVVEPATDADPVAAIREHLRDEPALVALDNLDHLDGAGLVILDLLRAAPQLTVLATSRFPLGVRGEAEVAIPPLAVPDADDPDAVVASPAGALFVARARQIGRLGRLDAVDSAAVAALCRRLDGLPLAIELAAARTRILSPGELLKRLERLGLGAIDPVVGDERRSITGIIDWTVGLLDEEQALALRAAAVCDGFDVDLLGDILGGLDIVGTLEHLTALGLVVHVGVRHGATRFRLLEPIREHVRRTTPPDVAASLAIAHATAVAARADAAWFAADAGEPGKVLQMALEIDNDRQALATLSGCDPDAGLRLWRRLHSLWMAGRLDEAIAWFARLRDPARAPSVDLARGLADLSMYVALLHGSAAGRRLRVESVEVARQVGDATARASTLSALAQDALVAGDVTEAERVTAELEELLLDDDTDVRLHAGEALAIAYLTLDGPLGERAIGTFEELIGIARDAGRGHMVISWLANVAFLRLCRSEHAATVAAARACIDLAHGFDESVVVAALGYLATAEAALGRHEAAVAALTEAVGADPAVTAPYAADLLRAGAAVEVARGRPLVAARLAGAAVHAVELESETLDPGDRLLLERTLARIRRAAREIDVELAIRDGAALAPRELVRTLPALLAEPATRDGATAGPGARDGAATAVRLRHGELTRREIEILGLVGRGKSDPEIAEILVISPKTASVHVANIKSKLGLQSRLEVALHARDLGLA